MTDYPAMTESQRLAKGWNDWADQRIIDAIDPIVGELADTIGTEVGTLERKLNDLRAELTEVKKVATDAVEQRVAVGDEIAALREAFNEETAALHAEIETLRGALGRDVAIVPLGKRRA
jgi:regulator of replication initiation timing